MLTDIGNTSDVSAVVNAKPEVVLYDKTGKSIKVAQADLAYWAAQGFKIKPFDAVSLSAEIEPVFAAAALAVKAFADDVVKSGFLDSEAGAAYATAIAAMREVESAWWSLERGILDRYDPKEAPATKMENPETSELTFVDPGQVAMYEKKGWVKA